MAEKLTTEQVLRDLGRTNINNINNINNNINNLITVNDFTPSGNQQRQIPLSVASPPEASSSSQVKPLEVALATREIAPWRYIKIDLFDNATQQDLVKNKRKFKIKLAFLLHNNPEYQYLAAALNTPWRNIKRGFDFSDPNQLRHYNNLERLYQSMSRSGFENIRASKCYEPSSKGKGMTIFGTSVILAQDSESMSYVLALMVDDQVFDFVLDCKTVSEAQRKANCIATVSQGENAQVRKTAKDFFRR